MDPNLDKIKQHNMGGITHGHVQKAISHAEDYLQNILGHKHTQVNIELNAFIQDIKDIRRKSRGQNRKK
jgi:hypothetical protein